MSLRLDPERADILLRALAREHLCLRADGRRDESVKDLMREIVRIAFGVDCGPKPPSVFRTVPVAEPARAEEKPAPNQKRLIMDPNTGYMVYRRQA